LRGYITDAIEHVFVSNSAEAPGSQPPSHGDHLGERPAASPSNRVRPVDVALVAAIPAVLVAVFLLPMELRRDLALLYTDPSVLTMYASHFVHLDLPHLTANLLVYLLVVPFSLAVSVWSGRRRRFYAVAVVVLVAFPLVLSGLNVLLPRPRIGMGFSGMNLAFVGYLPHVLADRFEAERPEWKRSRAALLALLFFVGTAVVTVRITASIYHTAQPGLHWLLVAGAGSLAAAVALTRPLVFCLRSKGITGEPIPPLAALGSLLFVLLLFVSFPDVSPADGSVVNLFLHFLGFSIGYIVPYVAFQILGLSLGPRSDPVRK
jgi:hypothetical protein